MEEFEGNGDGLDPAEEAVEQAFQGAKLDVSKMKREDGILTRGLSNTQQSVLQRSMTAVSIKNNDEDYRQELKTGFFLSTEESDNVVAAINESDRYGCSRKPIVDWLVARSAGVEGGRLRAIFDTISHTTFTTNYASKNKGHWWSSDKSRDNTRNPLER